MHKHTQTDSCHPVDRSTLGSTVYCERTFINSSSAHTTSAASEGLKGLTFSHIALPQINRGEVQSQLFNTVFL